MAKKKSNSFILGLIFGIVVGAGAVYYIATQMDNSDTRKLKKESQRIEKQAKKEIDKAGEEVKKLFDKKD